MINEKMLEYLMLNHIITHRDLNVQDSYNLEVRQKQLEDEFINEQLAYLTLIKTPEKDNTSME
jgi:hypothetical protein